MELAQLIAFHERIDVQQPDPDRDSVDGIVPGLVVEPHTAEGVAAVLAWASAQRLSVVIRGGGTKLAWGRRPDRVDVILSTRRLNRVLTHRAGDLTVWVEAGASLGELNASRARHSQWLPLDPPFAEQATIGGLLATNDSGPQRHRFGTPRDLVIGIHVATADGRLAKAGGHVVKNVAGYELSKLVSGSFGGLAAIVSATFKLSPAARASGTVIVDARDSDTLTRVAAAVASSQLVPVAFEFRAQRTGDTEATSCLLRFASSEAAVNAQIAGARACVGALGLSGRVVTGDEEFHVWREHSNCIWCSDTAVVRASFLPAHLADILRALGPIARRGPVEVIGRAAVGSALISIGGDTARQAAAVDELRSAAVLGNVVLVRASTALKSLVDVWGQQRNTTLLESLKRTLDPHHTLGAGRGPL